jgi:hypothetical protein
MSKGEVVIHRKPLKKDRNDAEVIKLGHLQSVVPHG